jgi:ubiquinone/menaquinone biosynthesis C-methylase UbiE
MDNPMSNLHFRFMSLGYKFRDFLVPRINILREVGIQPGFHVLDYGCGPGSYLILVAELVGKTGKVYALDIHPLAVQRVRDVASKKQLENVETIRSDCKTGLPDRSIDVVLLYDILHDLNDSNRVLGELYRVMKPHGVLSFSDHHMRENEILSNVTDGRLFKLLRKGKKTYSFAKE